MALKSEIGKASQDGPKAKRPIPAARKKQIRSLNPRGFFGLKSQAAIKPSMLRMGKMPLSPLGRKIRMARKVPIPAPMRSKKYKVLTILAALVIAKERMIPAKKNGMLNTT